MNLCMKQMAIHASILAGKFSFPGNLPGKFLPWTPGAWQAIIHGVAAATTCMYATERFETRQETGGCQGEEGLGEGWVGSLGLADADWVYTERVNKILQYSAESCIQYSVINRNGKNVVHTYVYITESLWCKQKLTLSMNCTSTKIHTSYTFRGYKNLLNGHATNALESLLEKKMRVSNLIILDVWVVYVLANCK